MVEQKKYELAVVSGVEGPCVSLNHYRVAGPKPWGGGQVAMAWRVTAADLLNAAPELLIEERARIRREMLDEITKAGAIFAADHFPQQAVNYLERALDRVCPEEHVTPPAQEAEGSCPHEPSGMEDVVGTSCTCTTAHSRKEQCARCGAWVLWHDFPGRELHR